MAKGNGEDKFDLVVVGSGPGGYVLWAAFVLVQLYAVVRSIQGKRRAAGTVDTAAGRDRLFS